MALKGGLLEVVYPGEKLSAFEVIKVLIAGVSFFFK
jgi:hypothetical protein